MKKRIAIILAAASAMGTLGMVAAHAEDPVADSPANPGCGLYLDANGAGPGFYTVSTDDQGNQTFTACNPAGL